MKTRTSLTLIRVTEAALAAGMKKHVAKGVVLRIAGVDYTAATATAILEDRLQTLSAVEGKREIWKKALDDDDAKVRETKGFVAALKKLLRVIYAAEPDTLVALGLPPRKAARALTVEERAAAIAKTKATRAARHTMGARQKLDVVGDAPAAAGGSDANATNSADA